MTAGVALAVALLLAAGAVLPAAVRQGDRVDRRDIPERLPANALATTPHLLWSVQRLEAPGAHALTVISVAPSGSGAPAPLGARRVPAPHTVLVSPALRRKLRDGESASRRLPLPGPVVGELDRPVLATPDDLVMMVGWDYGALHAVYPDARAVKSFTPGGGGLEDFGRDFGRELSRGLGLVALILFIPVGTVTLLLPLLVFIGTTARLGARRREERLTALRLVGATPTQVRKIAAVEAATAAVIGSVLGLGIALVAREVVTRRGWGFRADFTLPSLWIAVVLVLTPVLAAVSAVVALVAVDLSPLAVTRRSRPPQVRPIRWFMVVVGLTLLVLATVLPDAGDAAFVLAAIGVPTFMLGLVFAGPHLVRVLARRLIGRAERPAGLLAARRLDADPRTGFRAVTILVLAVFVTTWVTMAWASVRAGAAVDARHRARPDLVLSRQTRVLVGYVPFSATDVPPSALAAARAVNGVDTVVPTVSGITFAPVLGGPSLSNFFSRVVVADCADYARAVRIAARRCRPGVLVRSLRGLYVGVSGLHIGYPGLHVGDPVVVTFPPLPGRSAVSVTVPVAGELPALGSGSDVVADALVPPALVPAEVRSGLVDAEALVRTDGARATAERIDAAMLRTEPGVDVKRSVGAGGSAGRGILWWLYGPLAFVLVLAACGLAVTTVDGVFERRRSLVTLRAAGTPTSVLQRASMLEVGAPLAAVAILADVSGLATGALFVQGTNQPVVFPWITLLVVPALLVAVWLVVTALALPAIGRVSALRSLREA